MYHLLAQPQNNNVRTILLIVLAVFVVVNLLVLAIFARYFRIWMRCFMSRADVKFTEIIGMSLRKCPPALICDARIMSVQAGIPVSTNDLQQAFLSGVDVELAVRAMIRAQEIGAELSWEDAVSQAKKDQYDDYLQDQNRNG